jgi:hypothetical protein
MQWTKQGQFGSSVVLSQDTLSGMSIGSSNATDNLRSKRYSLKGVTFLCNQICYYRFVNGSFHKRSYSFQEISREKKHPLK